MRGKAVAFRRVVPLIGVVVLLALSVPVGIRGATSASAASGPDRQLWAAPFDTGGADRAWSAAVSPDGRSVFVAGDGGRVAPERGAEYIVQSYDTSTGGERWTARTNGRPDPLSNDYATGAAVAPDGSEVVVTGYAQIAGSAQVCGGQAGCVPGVMTVAYDPGSGEELWRALHGAPDSADSAIGLEIAMSPDSRVVYVAGRENYVGVDRIDEYGYLTLAIDAATGEELWSSRYTYGAQPGGYDALQALAVAPDGETVYVTGLSEGTVTPYDYATVAYDATTGARRWVARYSSGLLSSRDEAFSIAANPDGSAVYVTGRSAGRKDRGEAYATVSYDASTGEQLWVARYARVRFSDQEAFAVAVAPDGRHVYVTGRGSGAGLGGDFLTLAYGADSGTQRWTARYDGPANARDRATALVVAPDASAVFVTGWSTGIGSKHDYATVAYDPASGSELWVERYGGAAGLNDKPRSIAIAPDSEAVFVTGWIRNDPVGGVEAMDFGTVAYATS